MASSKHISISSIPKPGLSGRPQSNLDWNIRWKPAITPRREYAFMRNYSALLCAARPSGPFGSSGSEVSL